MNTSFTGSLTGILSAWGVDPGTMKLLNGSYSIAGSTISVDVQGLAELEIALGELPDKIAKGTLVKAITAAGELFRARASELAPYDDYTPNVRNKMHLKEGILKKIKTTYRGVQGATVQCLIGLDKAKGESVFYGRFIEMGWLHIGGKHIPAHPFMRPAFEEKKTEALALVVSELLIGVEAAARELHAQ
jgi:HK97 gp10 family phage protein